MHLNQIFGNNKYKPTKAKHINSNENFFKLTCITRHYGRGLDLSAEYYKLRNLGNLVCLVLCCLEFTLDVEIVKKSEKIN